MSELPLRVVSEQSQESIDRQRALDEVGATLRAVATNMIRVIRGAGKSFDLMEEMIACVQAFQDFRNAYGAWPDDYSIQAA
jgi:hypothetical protein